MKSRYFLALSAAILMLAAAGGAAAAATARPAQDQIERKVFFGNPSRRRRASARTAGMAFLAPRDGVLNVWVAPVGRSGRGQAAHRRDKRGRSARYFWSPDSTPHPLSPGQGRRRELPALRRRPRRRQDGASDAVREDARGRSSGSAAGPGRASWSASTTATRAGTTSTASNLATGALSLVLKNPGGFAGFIADERLNLRRCARSPLPDGGDAARALRTARAAASRSFKIGLEDALTTGVVGFTATARPSTGRQPRPRHGRAGRRMDMARRARRRSSPQDPRADIGGAMRRSADRASVEAYCVDYLKRRLDALDPAVAGRPRLPRRQLHGRVRRSPAHPRRRPVDRGVDRGDRAGRATTSTTAGARRLTQLFANRPELEGRAAGADARRW